MWSPQMTNNNEDESQLWDLDCLQKNNEQSAKTGGYYDKEDHKITKIKKWCVEGLDIQLFKV